MATYFINPIGSETAPYDTADAGCVSWTSLFNNVTGGDGFVDGDIVEVVQGTIVDTATNLSVDAAITMRSYALNTQKPLFSVGASSSKQYIKVGGGGTPGSTFQNLSFTANFENVAQGALIGGPDLTVEDCDFVCTAAVEGKRVEAIHMDSGGYGVTIRRCTFLNCRAACIAGDINSSVLIENNLIIGCGTATGAPGVGAVQVQGNNGATSIKIFNNSFYDCMYRTIVVLDSSSVDPYSDVHVKNNIIHGNNKTGVVGVFFDFSDDYLLVDLDYNDVYGCATTYSPHALAVVGAHSLLVDPLYTTPGSSDLSLQAGSPCLNVGIGPSVDANVPTPAYNGVARAGAITDMGAYQEPAPVVALNSFTQSTVSVDSTAVSNISRVALVAKIQAATGGDTYFDSTSKLGKVCVYYTHQDGREVKILTHTGLSLTGLIAWSDDAKDGTWQKNLVRVFDHDGAEVILNRLDIGTNEDLTKSGSTINLNT